MNKIVILLGLLVLSQSLYTSSYWAKKGIDTTDGILQ